MTAHHFFIAPTDIDGATLTISGEEAHHAARVLRLRVGEAITAADDTGRVVHAVVTRVDDVVHADVVKDTFVDETRPRITLFQALSKGDKLDDVVQKAAEIGVARVAPFVAARSVVRWDDHKRSKAVDRWRAVARAAAKQSRSPRLLEVDDVTDGLGRALEGEALVLVLHEGDNAAPLRHVLPEDAPERITLAVGPEGGFSNVEIDELSRGGAEIVRLGPRILRTETAGIVAVSIVAYVYGALG